MEALGDRWPQEYVLSLKYFTLFEILYSIFFLIAIICVKTCLKIFIQNVCFAQKLRITILTFVYVSNRFV